MKNGLFVFGLLFILVSCSGAPPVPADAEAEAKQSADMPPSPESAVAASADDASWRKTPPQVGPPPDVVIPVFEQKVLPNGLTVMVAKRDTLPLVSMALVLSSGSAVEESTAQQGLADFTYEMMMEGTKKRDGIALAEAFADLGTEMVVRTSEDGAAFKALLLKKNLNAGLDLLAEILTAPAFKKKDFLRKQKERIADLQSLMGNPNYLSSISAARRVYGAAHPYAHPVMGMPKIVEGYRLTGVRKFYRQQVAPQHAALVLAGDISLDEAVELANKKFGSWKSDAGIAERTPHQVDTSKRPPFSLAMVAKPGMNQTIISAGVMALPLGHPDEWALRVAIDAFGGMFGSRLNMNLREDKGYTYGARGNLDAMFLDGAAMFSTSVQGDVTGAALSEIIAELDALKRRPLTEEEFHAATENVVRSVSGWFETVSGLGNAAQSIYQRQLPLTRYEDMVSAYGKLTLADVRKAADRYLDRAAVQVVLVGDPEIIKAQLAGVSLGEPELLTLE